MDLSEFKKLSVPELKGCGIKDLRNLKIPNTLKKFDISLNKSLKYIDLHDFNNLEELTLIGCNIRRIELSKNVKDKIVVNMAKINYS